MKNFKILLAVLVITPVFVLAQTSLDSSITNISPDTSIKTVDADLSRTTDTTTSGGSIVEPVIKTVDSSVVVPTVTNTDYTRTVSNTADPITTTNSRTGDLKVTTTSNTYTNDTIINSVTDITNNLSDLEAESKLVESEVRAEIKDGIDSSIIYIKDQTNIEAYELQKAVDTTRNTIYQDINTTISNTSLTNTNTVTDLQKRVESAVIDIEKSLENTSGVDVDLSENKLNIQNTFLRYQEIIEEKTKIIEERGGDLLTKDTDKDGLSDYDEKFIYNTNPENAFTVAGELNDAQKVLAKINPTDPESKPIEFQDPRTDKKSVISKIHKLDRVELVNKEEGKRLKLEGTALPNSFVTVYVFSDPVIVTVKTNERGEWTYTLDKELEDGQHEVYVATVDNTGRLIARSEKIDISQTDDLAALGVLGSFQPEAPQYDFVRENFVLIVFSTLLFALIVVLILSGNKKGDEPEVLNTTSNDNSNNNQS